MLEKLNTNLEFTMEVDVLNEELIKKLCDVHFPDEYEIEYTVLVQARTHRKKRVNKKWAKRYGFRFVKRRSNGWKIKTGTDGTVEFIKEFQNGQENER